MEKSIMSLADDILGGALTSPAKAKSAVSNPYNEPELPEVLDEQRESIIMESINEKLGPELKKFAKKTSRDHYPGDKGVETRIDPSARKASLSAKAKSKLSRHDVRKTSRDDEATSWAVDRRTDRQKANWQATRDSQKAHRQARGVQTRGAKPTPTGVDKEALLKKKREAEEKRRRSQGIQARKPGMENSNLQILLQARDILREMTSVGAIGTGPQMTASRAYSTHGANMGKDTVPVKPVDKSMRKVEKGKASKKKAKKVKKESFELFLDRILNEHLGDK